MSALTKIFCLIWASSLAACAATPPLAGKQTAELLTPVASAENNVNIVINTKKAAFNAAGEKLICKEYNLTGSRLKTVKSCHTKARWDAIKNETQRNIQDMYIKKGSDHG